VLGKKFPRAGHRLEKTKGRLRFTAEMTFRNRKTGAAAFDSGRARFIFRVLYVAKASACALLGLARLNTAQAKTGCGKTPHSFCHSERSEESLFLFMGLNLGEILRSAQNDKVTHFFRRLKQAAEKHAPCHSEGQGLPEESAVSWKPRRKADPSLRSG